MKALITRKIGMTVTIKEDGSVQAITLLSASSNTVTQLKSTDVDGYSAVQVGSGTKKQLGKALAGHVKAAKIMPAVIREFRTAATEDLAVGTELTAEVFSVGDKVKVTGITKGKGWAGTIKRHGFHRGRKTHGGGSYRRPGSIGSMYPQKIFKGKKMAGQMGHVQLTVRNLTIALVDPSRSVIGVTGAVPGPKKSVVLVQGVEV